MVAVYGILYSTLQIDDELLRISALLRSISVISTDNSDSSRKENENNDNDDDND